MAFLSNVGEGEHCQCVNTKEITDLHQAMSNIDLVAFKAFPHFWSQAFTVSSAKDYFFLHVSCELYKTSFEYCLSWQDCQAYSANMIMIIELGLVEKTHGQVS